MTINRNFEWYTNALPFEVVLLIGLK
jgi:hypothetical protein